MPELPDVSLYVVRLRERILGQSLVDFKAYSPFVLRSVAVAPQALLNKKAVDIFRLGKRIVIRFEDDLFLVVHLMIAGRFTWMESIVTGSPKPSKIWLARWNWPNGTLILQEASPKKKAGIWIVSGEENLSPHRRLGLDVLASSFDQFRRVIITENRTLKRALTDPNGFDGIGNAYSDEILFQAQLSPIKLTKSLSEEEMHRLYLSAQNVLKSWTQKLQANIPNFPKSSEVTAFRKEFNVHGKFGSPCQVCGAPIQRIVGSENEMNYCARCQNNGKVLADRSLSRLLKDDWPKTIEQLMSGD